MVTQRRKSASSEQFQALTDANRKLQADKMLLQRVNSDLKAGKSLLEQRIKSLQVAITILVAGSVGLSIGLATSMAGATAQTALASATGAFFAVITVSLAILMYMRR
jgi:ABC-type phosphate transport system auxiliary subunit